MLKLLAPGTRKGNRCWIARGRINGQRVEISTHEVDKAAAERFALRFAAALVERGGDQPRERTFREAADAWIAQRKPSSRDEERLALVCEHLGDKPVASIGQDHIVNAIQLAWPGLSAASWNRNGIVPIAAVLHYASENRWCEYRRVKRFREPPATPRALSERDARKIITKAKEGTERRLVLLLFGLAQRITDTLRLTWADIDLKAQIARVPVSKTGRTVAIPIPRVLLAELRKTPVRKRVGRVLPGVHDRWQAYDVLAPISERAQVRWTPHQARHTVGTMLARSGASTRAIMAALGHANVKSSIRYQDADLEMARQAQDGARRLWRKQKR